MRITKYEIDESLLIGLADGNSIRVFTHRAKKVDGMTFEDLRLEFPLGPELQLKLVRNVRNTERGDLIVLESEATTNVLFCGGTMAYLVSPIGIIVSSFETGYPKENAPAYDTRYDICGFTLIPCGSKLALVWDYGVVITNDEFNVISRIEKGGFTFLESNYDDELVFENRSTEVLYRLKLDDSLKPLMVLEELV